MSRQDPVAGTSLQAYLKDISSIPLLTADEACALAERIAQGDLEARDTLVRSNLRLVVNIARGYLDRGLPLDDLIAEGNMGLVVAAERFDLAHGVVFTTYAGYWIKQTIGKALVMSARPIRLPAHFFRSWAKWQKTSRALRISLGRSPTDEEVRKSLGWTEKKLALLQEGLSVLHASHFDVATRQSNLDPLVAETTNDPLAVLEHDEEKEMLLALLKRLPSWAVFVLSHRHGLGKTPILTNAEIGRRLGCTREHVRKLAIRAMDMLLKGGELPQPNKGVGSHTCPLNNGQTKEVQAGDEEELPSRGSRHSSVRSHSPHPRRTSPTTSDPMYSPEDVKIGTALLGPKQMDPAAIVRAIQKIGYVRDSDHDSGIDPVSELEAALTEHRRLSGSQFIRSSQILDILTSLGWYKRCECANTQQ